MSSQSHNALPTPAPFRKNDPARMPDSSSSKVLPDPVSSSSESIFDEFIKTERNPCIEHRQSISDRISYAFAGPVRSPLTAEDESNSRRILASLLPSVFRKTMGSEDRKRPKQDLDARHGIRDQAPNDKVVHVSKMTHIEAYVPTELRSISNTTDATASVAVSSNSGLSNTIKDKISLRIYRTDGTFATISCSPKANVQVILDQLARRFFIEDRSTPRLYLRVCGIDMEMENTVVPAAMIAGWLKAAGFPYEHSMWLNDRWREDVATLCCIVCSNAPAPPTKEELMIMHHGDGNSVDLSNCGLKSIPPVVFSNVSLCTLDLSGNWNLALPPLVFSLRTRNLSELRLNDLNLSAIPDSIRHATSLSYLDLSCNRIAELHTFMFEPLAFLTTLLLRGNQLSFLPSCMEALCHLNNLNLSSNQLCSIPSALADLKSLLKLDLSYNQLADLSTFPAMPRLNHLKLAGNQIELLPVSLADTSHLKKLDVQWNMLTDISVVHSLPLLKDINLTGNCLTTSIPPTRASILTIKNNPITFFVSSDSWHKYLTSLDISNCQLTSLPSSTSNLKQLEKLNVSGNQLTCLELNFKQLINLQELRVTRNLLQSMPAGLEQAKSLRLVDLHGNNIPVIDPTIWNSPALVELNLASNLIKRFPERPGSDSADSLGLVCQLRRLILADNQFDDSGLWHAIYSLTELLVLNLSCNRLNGIPDDAFTHWQKLECFMSSGNCIGYIPPSIDSSKNLRILCMNSNRLLTVPVEVGKLKNLEVLDLGCNQLKFNIHNYQYDWNWSWNRELRYLNLSGNQRFEIKEEKLQGQENVMDNDPATFKMLPKLCMLGLSDVCLRSNVPLDTEYCRVRTAIGEVGLIQFGVAELIPAKSAKGGCRDFVACRPRGFQGQDENLFAVVDYQPSNHGHFTPSNQLVGSRLLMKVADLIDKRLIYHLAKSQDVCAALRAAFLDANHRLSLEFPPKQPYGNRSNSELARVGASASVVFIHGVTLHVANVGDIGVILCRQGEAVVLSETHNLKNIKERNRVMSRASYSTNKTSHQSLDMSNAPNDLFDTFTDLHKSSGPAGSYISENGLLNGISSLTRQFGCFELATTINAIPHYSSVELTEGDEFVLVLSRTILSNISPQVAVDIVRQERNDMSIAAEKLRDVVAGYNLVHEETVVTSKRSSLQTPQAGMILAIGTSHLCKEFSRKARTTSSDKPIHFRLQRNISKKTALTDSQQPTAQDKILLRLDKEPDPPIGHVALVFTDVQSSTRLWEAFPNAMQVAIKLHHQLFRRLLRNPGRGYEVKTEGDAFMVAFPTVFHAARWCIAVQEQMLLVEWPKELLTSEDANEVTWIGTGDSTQGQLDTFVLMRGIRVRMGIHCGSPVCERDITTGRMDYYGRMVNRAARVSSSAFGGEITISLDVLSEFEEYQAVTYDVPNSDNEPAGLSPLVDESAISPIQSPSSCPPEGSEKNCDPTKSSAAAHLRRLNPFIRKLGTVNLKGLESETLWVMYPRSLQKRFHLLHPTADETLESPGNEISRAIQAQNSDPPKSTVGLPILKETAIASSALSLLPVIHTPSIDTEITESLRQQLISLTVTVCRLESAAAKEPNPDISPSDIWIPPLNTSYWTSSKALRVHFQSLIYRIENVFARLSTQG